MRIIFFLTTAISAACVCLAMERSEEFKRTFLKSEKTIVDLIGNTVYDEFLRMMHRTVDIALRNLFERKKVQICEYSYARILAHLAPIEDYLVKQCNSLPILGAKEAREAAENILVKYENVLKNAVDEIAANLNDYVNRTKSILNDFLLKSIVFHRSRMERELFAEKSLRISYINQTSISKSLLRFCGAFFAII